MGDQTPISWTNATWNPWFGCRKVSQGCAHCYMFREQKHYGRNPNVVARSKTTFDKPLHWKQPRKIFTCSWSDFFIEDADPWRAEAWNTIRNTSHLTYQILTKRPENIAARLPADWGTGYPNVWLGVSVEDQANADKRIPILLQTPAAIRFLSCEPLLGPVDIVKACPPDDDAWEEVNAIEDGEPEEFVEECEAECDWVNYGNDLVVNPEWLDHQTWRKRSAHYFRFQHDIDWVICGGESGPHFRPMDLDWARSIRDQCVAGHVPFFFKQQSGPRAGQNAILDGKEWHQYPDAAPSVTSADTA